MVIQTSDLVVLIYCGSVPFHIALLACLHQLVRKLCLSRRGERDVFLCELLEYPLRCDEVLAYQQPFVWW